jgi:hypothetical protein
VLKNSNPEKPARIFWGFFRGMANLNDEVFLIAVSEETVLQFSRFCQAPEWSCHRFNRIGSFQSIAAILMKVRP